ncbi:MAG: ATP-dependent DNA helicase RecG [Candidatus Paceibacterota bacterium]
MIALQTPIEEIKGIKGIGQRFLPKLKKLNIETVKDLLWHFPFRYEDFSKISKIVDVKINEPVVVQAFVKEIKLQRTWKKRMFIVDALIGDNTGNIGAVWFNQPFILRVLKKGTLANFAGKTVVSKNKLYLSSPVYEIIGRSILENESDTKHTGRLVPVYPETRGLTSKAIRFLIKPVLDNLEKLPEILPKEILEENRFLEINQAIRYIHFPENLQQAQAAKKRFAFEDLFLLQLNNLKQRLQLAREKSFSFKINLDYLKKLINHLPFELTQAQKKTLWEILQDFQKPHPMNRLLQGDVGSGKTIVAGLSALIVAKPFGMTQGKQSAFMAPTEILARQHYKTFLKFFPEFNGGIGLITSSEARIFYGNELETETKKNELIKKITNGEIKIIIGTHALIQESVNFPKLAFIVVDEQHRFGIGQRAALIKKSRRETSTPHFLSMSATPIPRTLSLTVFGDLDLSIIDELPKGRKEIITKIVAPANRDKAYQFIRDQIKKGRQVFVICPRIDPAEIDGNPFIPDVRAVKEEYKKLSKKIFPDFKVVMLHGKIKAKEKVETMKQFNNGAIDILVSTSVVEVGVDVPNASIMLIEGSERFGLAQLYQFRGRVGRGIHQSFCFLFTDSSSKTTHQRLRSLIDAKNGFELAEKDLAIRGPGQILGADQTGMPDLAMKAIQNPELIKSAREAAETVIKKDPELKNHPFLKNRLESFQKEVHLE